MVLKIIIPLYYSQNFFCICTFLLMMSSQQKIFASSKLIEKVSFKGSACPKESVFVDVSPDKEVLSILFDHFIIEKKGENMPFGIKKSCILNIWFKKDINSTFGVFSSTIEGAADLEKNLLGIQTLTIKVNRFGNYKTIKPFLIKGPYADEFSLTHDFKTSRFNWAPCGRKKVKLDIRTHVSIKPYPKKRNNASGFIAINAFEGGMKNNLNLVWKKCDPRKNKHQWIAFCKSKIFKKNKKLLHKELIIRSAGINKNDALKKAYKKSYERCSKINSENNSIFCVTKENQCSFVNLKN